MLESISIEVKQMNEAAEKVNKWASDIRKNIKPIGSVIEPARRKWGKSFMDLLDKDTPTSFWIGCEMAFMGVVDERLVLDGGQKAALLKRLPISQQRKILDDGFEINGRTVDWQSLTCRQLSDALEIGTVSKDGKFIAKSYPGKEYAIDGNVLTVKRRCKFTKEELERILETM